MFSSASADTLSRISTIAAEYHEYGGRKCNDLLDLLKGHGFEVSSKRTCAEIGMIYAWRPDESGSS